MEQHYPPPPQRGKAARTEAARRRAEAERLEAESTEAQRQQEAADTKRQEEEERAETREAQLSDGEFESVAVAVMKTLSARGGLASRELLDVASDALPAEAAPEQAPQHMEDAGGDAMADAVVGDGAGTEATGL